MNRHGVILDAGVDGAVPGAPARFVEALVARYVRPLARALFPAAVGPGDDAEHFAFTIQYTAGGDTELREHRDASVATLNINLNAPGEGYGGSTLYFVDRDDPGNPAARHNVSFAPGEAIVHLGSLRHGAAPIAGDGRARHNLVVWLFGAGGDVRVAPYAADAQLTPAARWAAGEVAAAAGQQPFVFSDEKLEL